MFWLSVHSISGAVFGHHLMGYGENAPIMVIENTSLIRDFETAQEKKERWKSIYVLYFSTFLMGLGFSTVLTGVWPYLDKLDPTAGKEFMGIIVAGHPLGQMLFAPLIGWWSNRSKSVLLPLQLCIAIFTLSNVWYSLLQLNSGHRKYWMLFTRFLTGISSSNMAVCRSYIAAATTLSERTKSVSMIAFFQVLGFIIGPGIQAGLSPLGDGDKYLLSIIPLNMYTAAGWINVFLGILNFFLFLPCIFKQRKIAAKEAMIMQNAESEKATWAGRKPDYISAGTLIVSFFLLNFHFVLLETLAAPLTMDQFGWSKQDALFYIGILMVSGALIACVAFFAISPLTKIFKESLILVWGGFAFMAVGSIFLIPWGPDTPPMAKVSNDNILLSNMTASELLNKTDYLGCPPSQEWCSYTPALTLTQFIISYALTSMGYPTGLALIQSLISKVLGPRPQGTWMGIMVGIGCLARVLGPVFISVIYTRYGTIWTFSLTTVFQFLIVFWLLSCNNRINRAIQMHIKKNVDSDRELKNLNSGQHG
ncbi:hypothetical protein RUM44_012552 [Polyplax serrata]|uniref:Major facilitator superfamily (MFS) profile domain-containing protein n=1 Tax=Polyplax serrata TaxID=468196 RepID=A0ABR1BFP9_POLSC